MLPDWPRTRRMTGCGRVSELAFRPTCRVGRCDLFHRAGHAGVGCAGRATLGCSAPSCRHWRPVGGMSAPTCTRSLACTISELIVTGSLQSSSSRLDCIDARECRQTFGIPRRVWRVRRRDHPAGPSMLVLRSCLQCGPPCRMVVPNSASRSFRPTFEMALRIRSGICYSSDNHVLNVPAERFNSTGTLQDSAGSVISHDSRSAG